jgi:spore coat-associated protein N
MGLKTKIGMAMATSAAGAAMVVGGSFALFSDYGYTDSGAFTTGTLKVTTPTGMQAVGTVDVGNMAPGDSATQSFVVTNSGTLAEWLAFETAAERGTHTASIWDSFSNSVDQDAGNSIATFHGLPDQTGSQSGGLTGVFDSGDFTTDNHPATYGYTAYLNDGNPPSASNLLAQETNLSGNDFNYDHPFMLKPGQSATVTYSVSLPLAAHNDYQNADGKLRVEVDAVQVENNWYTKGDPYMARQDGMPGSTANPWPFSWQPDIHQ